MTTVRPEDEFEAFFRASYARLVAVGVSMSAGRAAAQDVAQEALIRAYRRWDDVRTFDDPYAWVRRVTGNLLIDRYRSRVAEQAAVERLGRRSGRFIADAADADVGGSDRWHELVDGLTPQQRLVVTLRYVEDLPVLDIAAEMEIAEGTVKSALSKARHNVRRVIDVQAMGTVHQFRPTNEQESPR